MKPATTNAPPASPTEHEIRARALELYVRSGWIHGRDLENWLEAEAELKAEASQAGRGGRPARPSRPLASSAHPR